MDCSYSRNSLREDSESSGKGKIRPTPWRAFAVNESHTTAAVCFRPRCQLGLAASRRTRQSGWNPAAISMVRAVVRKVGQHEAMPTIASDGAGQNATKNLSTGLSRRGIRADFVVRKRINA